LRLLSHRGGFRHRAGIRGGIFFEHAVLFILEFRRYTAVSALLFGGVEGVVGGFYRFVDVRAFAVFRDAEGCRDGKIFIAVPKNVLLDVFANAVDNSKTGLHVHSRNDDEEFLSSPSSGVADFAYGAAEDFRHRDEDGVSAVVAVGVVEVFEFVDIDEGDDDVGFVGVRFFHLRTNSIP